MSDIQRLRELLREGGLPHVDAYEDEFLGFRLEHLGSPEAAAADMLEYHRQLGAAAADVHTYILAQLNDRVIPWWEIEDMLGAMNDDIAAYYTNAMRQELTEHPRYFGGSAQEWTDNL